MASGTEYRVIYIEGSNWIVNFTKHASPLYIGDGLLVDEGPHNSPKMTDKQIVYRVCKLFYPQVGKADY